MKKFFFFVVLAASIGLGSIDNLYAGKKNKDIKKPSRQNHEASTMVVCIHPVIKALIKANKHLDFKENEWIPKSKEQKAFLKQYMPTGEPLRDLKKKHGLKKFLKDELKAKSGKIADINDFLQQEGFDIQLKDIYGEEAFGVAAILKIALKWKKIGKETTIDYEDIAGKNKEASGMEMKVENGCCEVYRQEGVSGDEGCIVKIAAKSGDNVYITLAGEGSPESSDHIMKKIRELRRAPLKKTEVYEKVKVPMVNLDITERLDWLVGMELSIDGVLMEALQQTKFIMNHKGARVESAAAISVARCLARKPSKILEISRPFYIWIERPGVKEPFFAGYITPDHWENPGSLD